MVSFILRSVHSLLKNKLDKTLGLAHPETRILDPAAGTSTFLITAAQLAVQEMTRKYGEEKSRLLARQFLIVFDDQKPFREKVSGLPKAFYYQTCWEVPEGAGSPNLPGECRVFYADLWGSRESKFQRLSQGDIDTIKWQRIFPAPGFFVFVPTAPAAPGIKNKTENKTGLALYERFAKQKRHRLLRKR
jgi:hypothetical protein